MHVNLIGQPRPDPAFQVLYTATTNAKKIRSYGSRDVDTLDSYTNFYTDRARLSGLSGLNIYIYISTLVRTASGCILVVSSSPIPIKSCPTIIHHTLSTSHHQRLIINISSSTSFQLTVIERELALPLPSWVTTACGAEWLRLDPQPSITFPNHQQLFHQETLVTIKKVIGKMILIVDESCLRLWTSCAVTLQYGVNFI